MTPADGLGWLHQQALARLLAELVEGAPCPFCARPMFASQPLEADHVIPRLLGGGMVRSGWPMPRATGAKGGGSKPGCSGRLRPDQRAVRSRRPANE
jgi:hypothetical protein